MWNQYNLPPAEPDPLNPSQTADQGLANYRGRINVGKGSYSIHLEKTQGLWVGDDKFSLAPFSVDMQGNVVASGLSIGSLAGFTISSTAMTATAGGNTTIVSSGATAFTAGPTGSPTFTVTQAGAVTASSINITGGTGVQILIASGTFSVDVGPGGLTPTNLISITGLTGDSQKLYRLMFYLESTTGGAISISLRFNSDSGGNYSANQVGVNQNTSTFSVLSSASDTQMYLMGNASNHFAVLFTTFDLAIKAEKGASGGTYRSYTGNFVGSSATGQTPMNRTLGGYWNDTTNQLTSIQILGEVSGGSNPNIVKGTYYLYKAGA